MRLHELTENDIALEVHETLGKGLDTEPEAIPEVFSQMANEVVRRAEGVFLWVTLVLKSLLRGNQFDDTPEMFYKRLVGMPTGLDDFLRYMLKSIEKCYTQQAATLFSVALFISNSPSYEHGSLLRYSFLEDLCSSPDYALENKLDQEDVQDREKRMRNRLVACCKGPLEIRSDGFLINRVQFLHRSVVDFFEVEPKPVEDTNIQRLVRESRSRGRRAAEIFRLFCHSFLAELKSLCFAYDYLDLVITNGTINNFATTLYNACLSGEPLDFPFLDALDSALRRPAPPGSACAANQNFPTTDRIQITRVDLTSANRSPYAVFAFLGFLEILHDGGLSGRSSILPDIIDNVIQNAFRGYNFFVAGFPDEWTHKKFGSRDSPSLGLIDVAVQHGADMNKTFVQDNYPEIVPWILFITARHNFRGAYLFNETTMKMLELLLRHGADPYVWFGIKTKSLYWFRIRSGIILFYSSTRGRRQPGNERLIYSLRQAIELWGVGAQGQSDSVDHLPSHSQYEEEWKKKLCHNKEACEESTASLG